MFKISTLKSLDGELVKVGCKTSNTRLGHKQTPASDIRLERVNEVFSQTSVYIISRTIV